MCLTEGREHTGRYTSAVAVQRLCHEAEPPRTIIEPAGDGLHHIKWDHPERGVGCLTVMVSGPARSMLEPRDDCDRERLTQLFRIEAAGASPGGYRIRPAHADVCLGIRDNALAAQAEAVPQVCAEGGAQEFLIDLLPS